MTLHKLRAVANIINEGVRNSSIAQNSLFEHIRTSIDVLFDDIVNKHPKLGHAINPGIFKTRDDRVCEYQAVPVDPREAQWVFQRLVWDSYDPAHPESWKKFMKGDKNLLNNRKIETE